MVVKPCALTLMAAITSFLSLGRARAVTAPSVSASSICVLMSSFEGSPLAPNGQNYRHIAGAWCRHGYGFVAPQSNRQAATYYA